MGRFPFSFLLTAFFAAVVFALFTISMRASQSPEPEERVNWNYPGDAFYCGDPENAWRCEAGEEPPDTEPDCGEDGDVKDCLRRDGERTP